MKKIISRCGLLIFMAMGCAHEHLATYFRTDESTAMKILASRSNRVQTVSGSGTLELTQPNGDSVELDVAVALRPPHWARVRAWKFGHAVFDLTLTPDGLWLEASKENGGHNRSAAAGVTAAQVAKAWSLLSESFFNQPNLQARNQGDNLIVRHVQPNEPTVMCRVNRDTLLPTRYQMLDENGRVRFTLNLDHYKDFTGINWPMRVEAISNTGRLTVELSDVELNGELPPTAFKPPLRAEKQP